MQFTRFLRNRSVSAAEMSRHAGEQTGRRAAGRHVVAVQDSSELALGSRRARTGYGPVGNGTTAGLMLHPMLAIEAGTGALLGLVSMQVWNRDAEELAPRRQRATINKESQRWIDATKQAGAVLEGAASITMVSDRESDFYELFAERPHNVDLIVRACQNRRIKAAQEEPGLLFAFIDAQPEQSRFEVTIPAAPGRRARDAELAVRYAPVTVRRPLNGADPALPETVGLRLVDVREVSKPKDGSEPVHWRLLTTHSVATLAQARRVVDLYRSRWVIEEFFRTLKTAGFDIEAADIGDPPAMINLAAAATIAAVTIKQLVQARDGNTDQRLSDAFDPDDRPILEAVSAKLEGKTERQRNPHPKGSLAFAAWVIARLGGWTGYYGKPGPKVMRIGLAEFHAIKYGATLDV
ncbi:MAG: IS4 family transposase [Mesorhizobium sp.]|uniref:IS4 family transposase n=1 Tax=Mesorhizobium sp. TaxID=1871066 RepID=UPI000FE8D48E|nr:IS4 family transposase [Mesorhizobium sp.]RWM79720.1 MAG: IS4 family transposase [Mesorhizobium sp.]